MSIEVKLFAVAKEIAQAETFQMESDGPISIAEVREKMASAFPELARVLGHTRFAVNAAYATDQQLVSDSDEVAIIPPVSGG